jgi:hypothetical protein
MSSYQSPLTAPTAGEHTKMFALAVSCGPNAF